MTISINSWSERKTPKLRLCFSPYSTDIEITGETPRHSSSSREAPRLYASSLASVNETYLRESVLQVRLVLMMTLREPRYEFYESANCDDI